MKSRESSWNGPPGGSRTLRHSSHRREDLTSPKLASRKGALQLLTRPRENDSILEKEDVVTTHESYGGREANPSSSTAYSHHGRKFITNETPTPTTKEKGMPSAKKILNDSMSFEEFFNEYLTDNTNFDVVGAIGPQGAGKSTILSMLGGNDPQDMYRYYVFRPASREAIESSRYQTMKLFAYVGKSRTIFLDCQATNCSSMLEEALRHNYKSEERLELSNNLECIDIIALLLQVCQTVLVCNDWLFDMELFRIIRLAEGIRAASITINGLPSINADRRVNLVFILTKAKGSDFSHTVLTSRVRILRSLFKDSKRIKLPEDDKLVLVPLADLKPRKDTMNAMHSHAHQERQFVTEEVEEFEKSIRKLRNELSCLEKDAFSIQNFSERNWFTFVRAVWKDNTFVTALEYYRVLMST